MNIRYDHELKIVGLGVAPWTRLGPERWLPNYAIASLYGWDVPSSPELPRLSALMNTEHQVELNKINTQQLLQNEAFQKILTHEYPDYDILTYKPLRPPQIFAGRTFLMDNPEVASKYENKAEFRQMFADRLQFPGFQVYESTELPVTASEFERMMAGRSRVVLQDEQLSGGKGTYKVSTFGEYQQALQALGSVARQRRVVVSDLIEGAKERSIQGCVTSSAVYVGPLQRQIVGAHELVSADGDNNKFCGAAILQVDQDTTEHRQAAGYAQLVGEALRAEGYRGIFGIDLLQAADGRLYVIEVNPRLTGVTPLLTALAPSPESLPFYLLHILELGHYDYEVTDDRLNFGAEGSLLILHSQEAQDIMISAMPDSGTYTVHGGALKLLSRSIKVAELQPGQFVLQQYTAPGIRIKPGGRMTTLLTKEIMIDENTDKLYNTTSETISLIRQAITTEPYV